MLSNEMLSNEKITLHEDIMEYSSASVEEAMCLPKLKESEDYGKY